MFRHMIVACFYAHRCRPDRSIDNSQDANQVAPCVVATRHARQRDVARGVRPDRSRRYAIQPQHAAREILHQRQPHADLRQASRDRTDKNGSPIDRTLAEVVEPSGAGVRIDKR
jgi:hypothetical protein